MIRILLTPLSWFLRLLPKPIRRSIGRALGRVLYQLSPRRRVIAEGNLAAAYPNLSLAERQAMILKSFHHHGHFAVEAIEAISWTLNDFKTKIEMRNLEVFQRVRDNGKGGVLLGSHLGNWELGILAMAAQGIPFDVVAKGFRVKAMQNFMTWFRTRTGARVFSETVPPTEFWKAFSQGRVVCFVLDQFMGPPIGIPVKFFGQSAGTAAGLALITERNEVPVIPVRSFRDEKGNLGLEFSEPLTFENLPEKRSDRIYHRTQAYNDAIEKNIRVDPSQWTWIHRRWKAFNGKPRWVTNAALFFAISVLASCASSVVVTETGIALPPDPQIAVPQVIDFSAKKDEQIELGVLAKPTPVPSLEKKKKADKKSTKQVIPAADAPAAIKAKSYDRVPFEIGERQVLEGSWMGLPAGQATLEVRKGPEIGGRKTILLWGNALSSRLVDTVLHVDNTMESYVDAEGLFPYKFLLHMVETFQNKETRVSFDHTKGKAYYWAKRISQKMGNQDIDRTDVIVPLTQDMWSALFFVRLQDYELNKKFTIPVYENDKNMVAEFIPVANELVRTKAGVFQTWKILMELKLNSVLRPSGAMYMWVSDDSKRYLVKFDIKLNLGSLAGELVSVRERQ